VTELGVGAPRKSPGNPENPADALTAVIDNATALARAEVRLLAAEARAWLVRIGFGLAMLWLALSLLQVLVLVLALSPVLAASSSWANVGWAVGIALVPAAVVTFLAARELGRVKDMGHADFDKQSKLDRH
jgi:hypothetical protein